MDLDVSGFIVGYVERNLKDGGVYVAPLPEIREALLSPPISLYLCEVVYRSFFLED